ncbi:MFS transporter [Marinithermus hydrothermalis]|uniref:Major facilitator superfamily MFS_1 n=1 Tax=Marinithermus hydrothermalis (strain DSM 14884 / JCM 11576 / T1) TaxID=869210 RepID=F2NQP7_MARHT|nr:MFS transporter [Marinithermus hydrothermalis]AEB11985.1 major facilitator superfamily MFS_1 [Marinithermus hydrothermalis DSM 14884]
MHRLLPWRSGQVGVLLRFLLALGLVEFARSGLYAGLLPLVAPERLGLNLGVVGVAVSLHYLGDTFGRSFGGYLSDRFGVGWVVGTGALVGLAVVLWVPEAKVGGLLWGLALLHGLAIMPMWPGVMTLASRASKPGADARSIGLAHMLLAPFIGLGALATAYFADTRPRTAFTLVLGAQAIAAVLALSVLRVRGEARPAPPTRPRYPWGRLVSLFPAAFAQTLAPGLLAPILFPFAKYAGLSPLWVGLVIAVGGLVAYGLLQPAGRLADRYGPKWPLIVGISLNAITLLLLARMPPLPLYLLIAALGGLGYALMVPSWGGLVVRTLPEHNRAAAWGALMTFEGLGFAVGPALGGLAWTALGVTAPFELGASVYLIVALFYLIYLRRR